MFWLYLPVSIIGQLLSYILVPVAVYWADQHGRLPRVFRWLETHDALGWEGPLTEPATRKTTEIKGQMAGLRHWLWRNKAYTLRYWMRAKITPDMAKKQSGVSIPKRWGYSYWKGSIGPYWEFQPRIGFGAFHLKMRIGWKMKPYFDLSPPYPLSSGIFTGFSIRSDDWDDYEVKNDTN